MNVVSKNIYFPQKNKTKNACKKTNKLFFKFFIWVWQELTLLLYVFVYNGKSGFSCVDIFNFEILICFKFYIFYNSWCLKYKIVWATMFNTPTNHIVNKDSVNYKSILFIICVNFIYGKILNNYFSFLFKWSVLFY